MDVMALRRSLLSASTKKPYVVVWNNIVNGYLTSADWEDRSTSDTNTTFEDGIATIVYLNSTGSYRTMIAKVSVPTYQGHKYYCRFQCSTNNASVDVGIDAANIAWLRSQNVSVNEWGTYSYIVTGERNRNSNTYCPRLSSLSGISGFIAKVKNILVVDLTRMFGSGNEPSSVEFETLCAQNGLDLNQPYPYNFQGTQLTWYY